MYSPQIHHEVARQRQADMLRAAQKERLAALVAGQSKASDNGRVRALLSSLVARHGRHADRQAAVHPAS